MLIGTVITVNGVVLKSGDMIAAAQAAVGQENVHQIANALEFYYFDRNSYPTVEGGTALINLLYDEGYIRTKPLNPETFNYEPKNNGQDYSLTVTENTNTYSTN